MPRTLLAAAALVLAVPVAPRAESPPAAGWVETAGGRLELLSGTLPAGNRIEVPEGYLVVEEPGPDDGRSGSFAVLSAEPFATAATPPPAGGADAAGPADAAPGGPGCRAERTAYLSELWRQSGIDVKDPVALVEGLEAGATGPATGYWWFATATDAFRPLAWSSDLRDRADALARCVRAHGG